MGVEKLQEFNGMQSEAETALTNRSQTPQLSLVPPKQTDLDMFLEELADIIESEGGLLIP